MQFNLSLNKLRTFKYHEDSHDWESDEIIELVEKLSHQLLDAGAERGTKILYKGQNGVEHIIIFLCCEKNNFLYAPIYNELSSSEYENIKQQFQNFIEIKSERTEFKVKFSLCLSEPKNKKILNNQNSGVIFKTSGTTGSSNYIFHSYENIWNNSKISMREQKINSNSKIFNTLTYSHLGGFAMQTLPGLLAGSEVFVINSRAISDLVKSFQSATHMIIVPSLFRFIYQYCKKRKIIFTKKPLVVTGSVPVSNKIIEEMIELNMHVQVIYGLTEIGPYVGKYEISDTKEINKKDYFLGKVSNEYEIKLDKKNGEILLKGQCVGKNYVPETDLTLDLPSVDGWVKTGDAGEAINSNIYFAGRINLNINVAGFKVNPLEIEKVIMKVSSVKTCLVVGEKNLILGEMPIAYVVDELENLKLIKDEIKKNLTRYKWPRKIIFVKELPETSIGKTKKVKI